MARKDDIRAFFGSSVECNMDALYGVALRLTGKPADAEDLVAETVVRAWSKIDTLDDRSRFRPWVFRILRNGFISDYRKKAVRPKESRYDEVFHDEGEADVASLLDDQPDEFLNWWAEPASQFFNDLLREKIQQALDKLPPAFRVTIMLINVEGLTYDEAAEVLGVPCGTIRSRMKRGRTMLQKALWLEAVDAGLIDADRPGGDAQ